MTTARRAGAFPAGTAAALRLYAALPALRGNGALAFSAGAFAVWIAYLPHNLHTLHSKGLDTLYSRSELGLWWMGAFYAAAGLAGSYWSRVTSNIALLMPSMLAAEFAASSIAVVVMELVLAATLVALGAPPANALALGCLASAGGFGFGRGTNATGQSSRAQAVQTVVFLPLLFVGSLDSVVHAIGHAPWFIALALALIAIAAAIGSLRYRPAWAARQEQVQAESLAAARLRQRATTPRMDRMLRVLAWRPAPLREEPLPPGAFNSGTLGLALQAGVMLLLGRALGWGIHAFGTHTGKPDHPNAMMGAIGSVMVLSAATWLQSRDEWTRIFIAGRFGSRRAFANTLIRAHLLRTAHLAIVTAMMLAAVSLVFDLLPPGQALLRAVLLGLLIFCGSQLACVAAAIAGLSKLWINVGSFGAMGAVNLLAQGLLGHGWAPLYAGLTLVATLAIGIVVAVGGPARIARADWTPEDAHG